MFERGQDGAYRRHLALISAGRGHQHFACRLGDTGADRFRTEGLEKRRDHGADLQRTEYGHVKLADAAAQHEHTVPLVHAQGLEDIAEAVGQAGEFAIADSTDLVIRSQKTERGLLRMG